MTSFAGQSYFLSSYFAYDKLMLIRLAAKIDIVALPSGQFDAGRNIIEQPKLIVLHLSIIQSRLTGDVGLLRIKPSFVKF